MGEKTRQEDLARTLGPEVYVFVPDEQKHFIGEALLFSISGVLLAAFVKGLSASTTEQFEEWGRDCGEWISERIGDLFRDPDRPREEPAAVAEPEDREAAISRVGARFAQTLREEGMSQAEALKVSALVAKAALGDGRG